MDAGTLCRLRKGTGPFSSGTPVRVVSVTKSNAIVQLITKPEGKFLSNIKKHGIDESGIFEIPVDLLVVRRYQLG